MNLLPVLAGSNSGKGGGGEVRSAQEAEDTLQSKAYARFIDLIGEGPWAGFLNPAGILCTDCELYFQPVISGGSFSFPGGEFVLDSNAIAIKKVTTTGETPLIGPSSGYPLPKNPHGALVTGNAIPPNPRILAIIEDGDGTGAIIEVLVNQTSVDPLGSVYGLRIVEAGTGYTKGTIKIPGSIGQGIYFDDLALQRSDTLAYNFKGVRLEYRLGDVGQSPMTGFDFIEEVVENTDRYPIDKEDSIGGEPGVTFALENKNFDRLLLDLVCQEGFYIQDTSNGDIKPVQGDDVVLVKLEQEYQANGGQFSSRKPLGTGVVRLAGKTMAAYVKTVEVPLYKNPEALTHSWRIMLSRLSKDDSEFDNPASRHTKFGIARITGITDTKLSYPNCVLVGCEIDAEQFSSVPTRAYHMAMAKIKVPSNYFPPNSVRPDGTLRQFAEYNRDVETGVAVFDGSGKPVDQDWDGSFYPAWTNNPAWVFYAVCTEKRIGLGDFLPGCDKWTLYKLARYCDEPVFTGYFNGGYAFPEPRFTCNMYVQAKEEAYRFLSDLASCFRAAVYWHQGTIYVTQDAPQIPYVIFTEANVENGDFSYKGTPRRVRHTVAVVKFNDPEDGYKLKPVIVEDYDGILRLGRRVIEATAFACSSRGQARRFARWMLRSELSNTDAETHVTGMIGLGLAPGMVYGVLNKTRSQVDFAGRIEALTIDSVGRSVVTLDHRIPVEQLPVDLDNSAYRFFCTRPVPIEDLEAVTSVAEAEAAQLKNLTDKIPVFSFGVAPNGNTTVTLVSALPSDVPKDSVWGLENPRLKPQLFRCLGVSEQRPGKYEIAGIEYHEAIYNEIDNDAPYSEDPIRYDLDDWKRPGPPKDLQLFVNAKMDQGIQVYTLTASWSPPSVGWVREYRVYLQRALGNYQFQTLTRNTSVDFRIEQPDNYCVRVTCVGITGLESLPAENCIIVGSISGANAEIISGLELTNQGNDTEFLGANPSFDWRVNWSEADSSFHTGDVPVLPPGVREFQVNFYDTAYNKIYATLTKETHCTLSLDVNRSTVGGPHREFIIEVFARTNDGTNSASTQLRVRNVLPPVPASIAVTADEAAQVLIAIGASNAPDFAGYRVWMSTTPGFTPDTLNLVYQGTSNAITIGVQSGVQYYFRIAEYDLLSKDMLDCNISAEYSATGFRKSQLSIFDFFPSKS